jgi:parvulin-like peptidyl-prolyl isomerase
MDAAALIAPQFAGTTTREELLRDLVRYELLDPLVKAQAEAHFVSSYELHGGEACISNEEAIQSLQDEYKFASADQLSAWRIGHGLSVDADFLDFAHHSHKRRAVMFDLLSGSGETLFLRYKDRLDRVLYSLIRVDSEDLAYSLYYAIEAGDLEFGEAAAQNSIGPESKTQGIVGPVDLTTPHPEIAARLRTAEPRQLFSPFKADQWYAIIRLEYRFDSEYDDQTKRFLGGLLLSAKSQDMAASLRASYQSAAF